MPSDDEAREVVRIEKGREFLDAADDTDRQVHRPYGDLVVDPSKRRGSVRNTLH